jgi:hypothetical protein
MGTRYYLNTNQAAPVSPGFGVGAPQFLWTAATSASRCLASTNKVTGDTLATLGPRAVANNTNLLFVQGTTEPLPTGTVFSTSTLVKAQFQASESAVDDNIFSQLALKVVTNDGSSVQQIIRVSTDTSGLEVSTTLQNRKFATSDALNLAYTTVAGDRLVIEVGLAAQAGVTPSGSVRFGSDGTDLPEDSTETGSTYVGWVEFVNLNIFPVGGVPFFRTEPMALYATIAGLPVELEDWQFDSVVDQGYRTLTAKIPEGFTAAEQQAPVRVWLANGHEMWAGRLALDPVADRGKLQIRAEGYAEDLSASQTRMFYASDGFADWSDKEEDPFAGTNNDKYDLIIRPGLTKWRHGTADAFSTNDQSGIITWKQGGLITQYRFTVTTGASYSAFDMQSQRKTGPTGTNTDMISHSLAIAVPTTYTHTPAEPEDALILRMRANTNAGAGTRRVVSLTNMRVYGRTLDDDFTLGEVVADVGSEAGFDVERVSPNGLQILPLDWTDDHADLLDYMAELSDWHWEAWGTNASGDPILEFGPWTKTWTGSQGTGIRATVENRRRFNVVRVPFTYVSGAPATATATADPDPFPGQEVILTADDLEDPQGSTLLPDTVAAQLVAYHSERHVAGRVEVGEVFTDQGRPTNGFELRPGHLLDITDRDDLGPQRIMGVAFRQDGPPVVDLTDEFNVIRLLADLQRQQRRKRRRRKPKKGKK